ncbi:MAG: cyclic nucleotide-binding domain-containing protein [Acidimicrobiia bacterium]|nr:cyclic nucleotide-binding domain-containing protein [Acidimicrobiia bacterium]
MTGRGVGEQVVDHVDLLAALPGFDSLDVETKRQLSDKFERREADEGSVLITQGDPSPGLFVLLEGHVRVTQKSSAGTTDLNLLGPGAIFGEMSFVRDGGVAGANVVADSPVVAAVINPSDFASALEAHPDLAAAIADNSLFRYRANLLSQVFHNIDAAGRRHIADSIEAIDVDKGQIIVRQGEQGKRAYVLTQGTADVILESPDGNRTLATLRPGSLIGEASLLTDAPRDASVVMTAPGRVLALSRSDLLEAAGNDGKVSTELVSLLRMRWRPKQRPGIEVTERTTPEGDKIVVLKDPARNKYYRMAGDGAFIWNHLDGQTTLRDIAMGYLQEFGSFAPERIARAVHDLVTEGFALTADVDLDLTEDDSPKGAGAIAVRALGALAWTKGVDGVDSVFGTLYRAFRILFTRLGVLLLALVAIEGVLVSIFRGPRSGDFIAEAGGTIVLLGLIPANAIGAIVHEAAHGMTVKHFGRKVNRAGIGWYLITPVAFVDTSDMWLEDRHKRALMSAAGPFANLVLAGMAAIGAATVSSPLAAAILWQFVLASYYLALINLNPLLEFDGYYILSDFLDRPNLRDNSLRWIGNDLLKALRERKLKGHGVHLIYGAFALLYIVLVAFFMLVIYRLVLQEIVAGWVPEAVASGLAWFFALGVASIAALGTWAQMKGLNAPRH